ncbi:hypothetical protein, partial [Mesorhizobium sp.]|uniref:hypothetical protein n=1 Tax=Mesorhizobium sp. TaxID=1871066 RepID=UPI00257DFBB6
ARPSNPRTRSVGRATSPAEAVTYGLTYEIDRYILQKTKRREGRSASCSGHRDAGNHSYLRDERGIYADEAEIRSNQPAITEYNRINQILGGDGRVASFMGVKTMP